jgi:hypothetical protein
VKISTQLLQLLYACNDTYDVPRKP